MDAKDPPAGRAPLAAHAALAVAQLVFGLFPVFGKDAFEEVPPLAVAGLRVVFGAASLGLLALATGAAPVPDRRTLVELALCALFGIAINQMLFLTGLSLSTATHAGILVAATPAIAYGLGVVLGREAGTARAWTGVLLAGAGAVGLVLARAPGAEGPGKSALLGDVLLLVNVAAYSVYLVLVRGPASRTDPIRGMAWVFAFGALVVLPFAARPASQVDWTSLKPATLRALAFILIGPTVIAYLLNLWALKRASSTLAAVYTCLQPIVATAAAMHWRGERPPALETACATAAIVLGVLLVAWRGGTADGRP